MGGNLKTRLKLELSGSERPDCWVMKETLTAGVDSYHRQMYLLNVLREQIGSAHIYPGQNYVR